MNNYFICSLIVSKNVVKNVKIGVEFILYLCYTVFAKKEKNYVN